MIDRSQKAVARLTEAQASNEKLRNMHTQHQKEQISTLEEEIKKTPSAETEHRRIMMEELISYQDGINENQHELVSSNYFLNSIKDAVNSIAKNIAEA